MIKWFLLTSHKTGFVPVTSQAHSDTSSATAISPPAVLCTPLNALLFLVTGFKTHIRFSKFHLRSHTTAFNSEAAFYFQIACKYQVLHNKHKSI